MTEHEKVLLKEQKIAEARKAGEQAGRLGFSEHCRPWAYYGGPGRDEGNAWETAYREAKAKRNQCSC
jgi:hypothetical protein